MDIKIRSRLLQRTLILLTIIISFFLVLSSARSWMSYVYAGDPPPYGFKEALAVEKNNSEFYFLLAQFYDSYDAAGAGDQVYPLYQKALELNPLNYAYWFYMADSLFMDGRKEESLFALNQATNLAPGVVSLRWGAAMLASKLGNEEALVNNIRSVLASDPRRRLKAFPVLWQSLRNGDKIWKAIPDNALPEYLHFLISTRRVSEAEQAWGKLSDTAEIPQDIFQRYVSFLITENKPQAAKEAWAKRLGDWQGVWNGDFEKEITSAGFDWRRGKVEGVNITRIRNTDNRGYSLKIDFDGSSNVDFNHLRQIVPVFGNSDYELSSDMKSKGLSTRNGLFWDVSCWGPGGSGSMHTQTGEVLGTSDWHEVSTSFKTPPGCEYVVIRLRRQPDNDLGRKITGTVWIDNVKLEKQL